MKIPVKVLPQTQEFGYRLGPIFPKWHQMHLPSTLDMDANGEMYFLQHYLQPGSTVFDVGANLGDWSQRALLLQPTTNLFCFEPIPIQFQRLYSRISPYSTNLFKLALSDQPGRKTIRFLNQEDWGGSTFYFRKDHIPFDMKTMEVEVETLDRMCSLHQINKIDFLKIDVEGNELNVLKGAKELLDHHKVTVVQFEYGATFPDAGVLLYDVMRLLTAAGYVLFRLYYQGLVHLSHWDPYLENGNCCNYLAILRSEIPNYDLMSFERE
jgi:FkbM family methyltransferase